jgi:hypothetical protein
MCVAFVDHLSGFMYGLFICMILRACQTNLTILRRITGLLVNNYNTEVVIKVIITNYYCNYGYNIQYKNGVPKICLFVNIDLLSL